MTNTIPGFSGGVQVVRSSPAYHIMGSCGSRLMPAVVSELCSCNSNAEVAIRIETVNQGVLSHSLYIVSRIPSTFIDSDLKRGHMASGQFGIGSFVRKFGKRKERPKETRLRILKGWTICRAQSTIQDPTGKKGNLEIVPGFVRQTWIGRRPEVDPTSLRRAQGSSVVDEAIDSEGEEC